MGSSSGNLWISKAEFGNMDPKSCCVLRGFNALLILNSQYCLNVYRFPHEVLERFFFGWWMITLQARCE